ncbi:Rieske 2Fe-2S domain-containing protein [Pedobacter sp. SYSU D00535]|uniref:Rieske (2Fe-2S) protein n=1 Tax=Pedobacter sp. SYSU D00535 TaxID=2810308 RepID=UPI001A979339|nr:Rieske 2Fe-2S domain-containing protein [Pedobacter sp. SYSU D00535]
MHTMTNWVKVAEVPDDQEDFIRVVKVEGRQLLLVCHAGSFTVTQSICPHAGAHLSGGWCKNGKLVCPYHRYEYDLQTGRGAAGQGDYIEIYTTEQRSDGIYVRVPSRQTFFQKLFRL